MGTKLIKTGCELIEDWQSHLGISERQKFYKEQFVVLSQLQEKLLKDLPVICCYDKGCPIDKEVKKYIKSLGTRKR